MRAAYVEATGPASAIVYGDLPDPVAGPGQVVVRVEATTVNGVDTLLRSGRWESPVRFPLVLGRDLVGTVAAVGDQVSEFAPGDAVWTHSAGYGGRSGATAELVAVDADRLYRLPHGADPAAFIAAVHPATTAHTALLARAGLRPGETVAVVGANGAVGLCLAQVAAAVGARVLAVVRRPDAGPRLHELGASEVLLAEPAAVPDALRDRGVDVFVDTTGRVDLGVLPDVLAQRGRIVVIATRSTTELDVWRLYTKEVALIGFILSGMTGAELAAAATWINAQHARRPLEVGLGPVLRFADAAQAHAMTEAGALPRLPDGTVGRLVLRP